MKTKKLVVVEEHNIIGGLYTAISEIMAKEGIMVPSLAIGLEDKFAIDYGMLNNVRKANHLDSESIFNGIRIFRGTI